MPLRFFYDLKQLLQIVGAIFVFRKKYHFPTIGCHILSDLLRIIKPSVTKSLNMHKSIIIPRLFVF